MVEEALVKKEVYEAMMKMRANIDDLVGTSSHASAISSDASNRSRHSPEWEYVYGDGSIPEPGTTKKPIPADVMAVGDVERDKDRPVAPYIPPTNPQSGSGSPFPMLDGPMG